MAWTGEETRVYSYDGSDTAITETLDPGFKYTITVHGADGGDGTNQGGVGGYVVAEYIATNQTDVDIYVGAFGPDSGWGRFSGGDAGSGFSNAGGGSTEVVLSNAPNYDSSQLVTADAGGGGSTAFEFGSGGARCGAGGGSQVESGECPPDGQGFGGDGGDGGDLSGDDGGQEVISSRATSITETTGGSQHPDGTRNGYVEITSGPKTTVSGQVIEGGTAIQGAVVEAINQTTKDTYSGTTDSSGNFSFNVTPDTYHVVARYEDGEGKKRTLSKPYIDVSPN